MSARATIEFYQLKITLVGSKPPIWRRVRVPSSLDLAQLHQVIQISMGWENCHLHSFVQEKRGAEKRGRFSYLQIEDEEQVTLGETLKREGSRLGYLYDFGDGWRHEIRLEERAPFDPEQPPLQCVAGKRACPPEDVGGLGGYGHFLAALEDPNHPDHDEYREWAGEEFDPSTFDRDAVDRALARLFPKSRSL